MSIFLFATLDTKAQEAEFVRDRLRALGQEVTLVDVGCLGQPPLSANVSRETIYTAGGASLNEVQALADRGRAIALAAQGAAHIAQQAFAKGQLKAAIGLGGSAGTTIAAAAMRALPLGVPKVLVSTLASGQMRPFVRDKDIFVLNSVVDLAGLNRISRQVLGQAAAALVGLREHRLESSGLSDRPLLAATMFGVTTPCVTRARALLEAAGYEVLVFHATGNGGEALESLIREGLIEGVLDLTTTELADELVGGVLSAGPTRLTAAAEKGVPQVVSVGALDMVNFGPPESVPARFAQRKFYQHNPNVTLMRTTPAENAALGEEIGRKVAASTGPSAILLPRDGVSAIDRGGQPFDDPAAREALFTGIRRTAKEAEVIELDAHINDAAFAEAAARKLLELLLLARSTNRASGRTQP